MQNMKEIWKDIKEYKEHYQISNRGNVRGLNRINDEGYKLKGKILKPGIETWDISFFGCPFFIFSFNPSPFFCVNINQISGNPILYRHSHFFL